MSKFIEVSNGYVNLDHVIRITTFIDEDKRHRAVLYTIDERHYEISAMDLDDLLATVIPAAASQGAVAIYVTNDDGARPVEADIWHESVSVIGWRFRPCYPVPEPIFPESILSDRYCKLVLIMPNGTLMAPDDQRYGSLEQAVADFLASAQKNWDDAQARKIKSA